jgi:hypothetical protein
MIRGSIELIIGIMITVMFLPWLPVSILTYRINPGTEGFLRISFIYVLPGILHLADQVKIALRWRYLGGRPYTETGILFPIQRVAGG